MGILQTLFHAEEDIQGSKFRAVFIGLFVAFGGILFGYDTGTISGVLAMDYVKEHFTSRGHFTANETSLITAILSAGTFCGAMLAPLASDTLGRRLGLIISTLIFAVGVILQVAATGQDLLIVGRVVAGAGVGVLSAIVPLYQSEASPKWIRGAVVSCYQWAITIGLLLAACVNQGTHARNDSGSYRIPIALQLLWAIIMFIGMVILPESPRFYIMKEKVPEARKALSRLRGLPEEHEVIQNELEEISANYNYEKSFGSTSIWDCFKPANHQLKRIFIGIAIQALQQLTGINFIFYYGTQFFQNSGIKDPFIIQLIMNVVNVVMTVPGIALVEIAGRRNLLLWGAIGMCVSELIVAAVGTALPDSFSANKTLIAFSCTFIASFAATWGPLAWVVVGEIFPLRVRAKSVAVCAASNWLFNFAIAYATPYLVDSEHANLQSKVFFIWGGCTFLCFLFVYFFIYETKGLTLEQIDELFETCPSARYSKSFVPSSGPAVDASNTSDSDKAVVEVFEKV
ncbi:sugar porter family MFS transporter [Lachancea thermotolerans CBS 6340]|uniref:KLTH0G19404p n=1 Tax=Lachancea thermotolerans (strain ATCC 56472 / CBS 6340 / NRRL Y-8284) TaxID=559295 RepID=C5DNS3_LACTC|nr:KLTH0G19404p [Lachancea thermotolerans CBS 6340]CAR25434.1 KLTH0G19404p [Lachancea thermotolerans CBS 6340]